MSIRRVIFRGPTKQVLRNHEKEERSDSSSLDDFSVQKINQIYDCNPAYLSVVLKLKLKDRLIGTDVYVPINVNECVVVPRRQAMHSIMKSVREKGFPKIDDGYVVYHFRLPSQGSHPAVHFDGRVCDALLLKSLWFILLF